MFAQRGELTTAEEATKALREIGSLQDIVQKARTTGQVDTKTADEDLGQLDFLFKFFRSMATGASGIQGGMSQGAAKYMYPESEKSPDGVSGDGAPAIQVENVETTSNEVDSNTTTSSTSVPGDTAVTAQAEAEVEYARRKQALEDVVSGITTKQESAPSSSAAANSKLKSVGVHNFEFSDEAWQEFVGLVEQGRLPMNIAVHFGLPIGAVEDLLDVSLGTAGDKD
jgi:hypothetical protein